MSEHHRRRKVTSLDGLWEFAWLGDVDPDEVDVTALSFDEVMVVPGCFDTAPAYAGQRGLTAYRRMITLDAGVGHARIVFGGVHHWCRVFLNGVPLRDHAGGFTRFAVDLDDAVQGTAELVVLVDNRFDADRVPLHLEYFDWYHYGGITRGVELHQLGALWIDDVQVETVEIAPPTVRVRIRYHTAAPGSPGHINGPVHVTGTARLELALDGYVLGSETVNLASGAGTLVRTLEVPGADLWSPSEPYLHLLEVRLGEDDVLTRIGIRQVTVGDRQIFINGEPVRLLGFNRHEAHPQFGHAVPEAVMLADIQQLRDMGCNFVRGSHYPQDPRFLELCDAYGICVWNEAIGWQHTAEHLTDARFIEGQLLHIDEMVADAYNHPSVIMWGILNESHSHDPACRPAYEALLGRLRELDATRPVTYASNHPFDDVCMDLLDIISVNCYPGWYGSEIEDIPAEIDRIVAHVDATQRSKPFILSEIGAGAIYGWRDAHVVRWTESYQSRLLETVIRHLFIDRDRAMGLAIWQFCDCRTSNAIHKILGRPRGFNNKGVVDEYRRPKQAYDVVKQLFHEIGTTLPRQEAASVVSDPLVVEVEGLGMSRAGRQQPAGRHTHVAIEGDAFLINGELTYAGRIYRRSPDGEPRNVAGLLLNARMVQGIFDDLNPATRALWDYPEDAPGGAGPWDPERNTAEFIAAMPAWRAAGLLSFTINLQGGSPQGYSQDQPWHNSAFTPQGELREAYMARLARSLDAADELGMVPIVGYFYFGQDQRLVDEASVIRATDNATDWLLARGYTHVLVEVGNEVDNRKYDHAILKADRCHELMERVRDRSEGRLLVSTSLCGNVVPPANLVASCDFILLHGNGVPGPDRIREMVDETRRVVGYRGQPILFNEDDHFDFAADDNHMLAALDRYAGWGYFDFRMPGEGHDEGYQSVPVNWTISSERKRGFFRLLGDITGER